jgi:hypothetical protein
MNYEYVRADELTADELTAGVRDGTLTFFRIDAAGQRWFRRMPVIRGVPADESAADD